jgi:hypothetical protein
MNNTTGLRFLRPYLSKDVPVIRKSTYIRFFNTTTKCLAGPASKTKLSGTVKMKKVAVENIKDRAPVELRIKELEEARALNYPRIQSVGKVLTLEEFQRRYKDMAPREARTKDILTVNGMCSSGFGVAFSSLFCRKSQVRTYSRQGTRFHRH